jgi:hypothetical protein
MPLGMRKSSTTNSVTKIEVWAKWDREFYTEDSEATEGAEKPETGIRIAGWRLDARLG